MRKIAIIWGLISGAIVSSMMAISAAHCAGNPDYKNSEYVGFASMTLAFSLIYVGIRVFRDRYNGGIISFGKAFRLGMYIALIASTMYVLVWAIEYNYVFPDFMEKFSTHAINELKASGAAQAKIDAKMKEMAMYRNMYKNPVLFTLLTYAEILPLGL